MLGSNEVIAQLGDIEAVCREVIGEILREHYGLPVVQAIEDGLNSKMWSTKREVAEFLGTSPAEITQIRTRIKRMPIEKIVSYAIKLDVFHDAFDGRKLGLAFATRMLDQVLKKRREAGENVTLELDDETVAYILKKSEEAPANG